MRTHVKRGNEAFASIPQRNDQRLKTCATPRGPAIARKVSVFVIIFRSFAFPITDILYQMVISESQGLARFTR